MITALIIILIVAMVGTLILGSPQQWLKDRAWIRSVWSLVVFCLLAAYLISTLVYTSTAGLPLAIQDISYNQYQLLSYSGTDTVNALVYGKNSNATYQDIATTALVWTVAVPKDQWKIPSGYTGPVYISRVAINGESKVVITDSPPKFP